MSLVKYQTQVWLLLDVLPDVSAEKCLRCTAAPRSICSCAIARARERAGQAKINESRTVPFMAWSSLPIQNMDDLEQPTIWPPAPTTPPPESHVLLRPAPWLSDAVAYGLKMGFGYFLIMTIGGGANLLAEHHRWQRPTEWAMFAGEAIVYGVLTAGWKYKPWRKKGL